MPTPHENLARSLAVLHKLQKGGRRVFQSKEVSRVHRERLLRNGFLQEITKGWLISSSPSARDGESTPWYATFWEFCARYCNERFGDKWHLSPEQSLLLHAENTVIPNQAIVYARRGTNNLLRLPFGTSLYDLKQPHMPSAADVAVRDGLRLFTPAAALVKVPENFFTRYPIEAQVALASLADGAEVLRRLLEGGHSVIAGRLAGAFRRLGRSDAAAEIAAAMRAANFTVWETDPFDPQPSFGPLHPTTAPLAGRLKAMWKSMRDPIIATFPKAPGLPKHKGRYLKSIEALYASDAYHSLSIEGYRVTPELIDRVREGNWDPDRHEHDRQNRDALAARGYWQAFQLVKETVSEIIAGAHPGTRVRKARRDWYRALFQPCVAAGLLRPGVLAGYRDHAVYLRTSRYVPPRWEAVRDAMPVLFDLIEKESEPGVRAVLGHWLFGFIHPYPDGNGRMARFLMNALLASGGYPWTVIRVEDRTPYLSALDHASIDMDISPFCAFIAERVRWSSKKRGI